MSAAVLRVLRDLFDREREAEDPGAAAAVAPRGCTRPSRPASTNSSKRSCGYAAVVSISRARGATRSWASLRTVAWSSASSGARSNRTGVRLPADPVSARTPSDAHGRGRSGAAAALAHQAATLACGEPAPHAVLLPRGDRELEAWLADRAHRRRWPWPALRRPRPPRRDGRSADPRPGSGPGHATCRSSPSPSHRPRSAPGEGEPPYNASGGPVFRLGTQSAEQPRRGCTAHRMRRYLSTGGSAV